MSLKIIMTGACPYPVPQGSQVFLGETARCLMQAGHDARLLVYGYGVGGEDGPVPVSRAWMPPWISHPTAAGPNRAKPVHDAALWFALRRAARDADVICAHNYEALMVSLWCGRRPVVYFAHNALADELPYYCRDPRHARWAARAGRWFDNTFPRRASRVIVPHRRLAGYLVLRGCDPERVTVIPPPVDATAFGDAITPASGDLPPVLYTGNLDAYQNLDLLVRAMEQVRAVRPEARLLIASATPPKDMPGAEHLSVGNFDAVRRALCRDAVVAVPRVSWSGYPIKMLNAMAAGRPVVACASAAWPLTGGENGIVVRDNDAEAFASALLRLMGAPRLRDEFGRNARNTILAENAPDKIAGQIEKVILQAMGR